jgi:protein-disulfide isomerase
VPYSPALIAAVARQGAAARRDFTATRRALDNVPASVRDFSNAVRRAREVQDAEKKSRVMKIGAVVVGGLALVYFLRGRK